LPPGRFSCTTDEVEAHFVHDAAFASSKTRRTLFDDFLSVADLIRRKRVRVPAAFLGGGFTSSSVDPSDVDACYVIDVSRIVREQTFQEVYRIVVEAPKNGIRVDGFLIPWDAQGEQRPISTEYLLSRGRWDDWWQRFVPKPQRVPPQRHHSFPVRGYLEVLLDGYS
jgi:hypothetical protein